MSHYFARLVTACSGDLHSQLARSSAQSRFVSLDECGEAFLNIEGHELGAGQIASEGRFGDRKPRSHFAHCESGLHDEYAQQNLARATSSCDPDTRSHVRCDVVFHAAF